MQNARTSILLIICKYLRMEKGGNKVLAKGQKCFETAWSIYSLSWWYTRRKRTPLSRWKFVFCAPLPFLRLLNFNWYVVIKDVLACKIRAPREKLFCKNVFPIAAPLTYIYFKFVLKWWVDLRMVLLEENVLFEWKKLSRPLFNPPLVPILLLYYHHSQCSLSRTRYVFMGLIKL